MSDPKSWLPPRTKGWRSRTPTERFFGLIEPPGNSVSCWFWRGSIKPNGYGEFYLNGRKTQPHRFSWQLHHGKPWPEGLDAMHSCDNRACVNPLHIKPGTRLENMQDAKAKGRIFDLGKHGIQPPLKTVCIRGHVNQYERSPAGLRFCRPCRQLKNRQRTVDE